MTGDCAALFKSNKQKVNMIAVDDVLPTIQWVKNFHGRSGLCWKHLSERIIKVPCF
jgi:hypothetical protein